METFKKINTVVTVVLFTIAAFCFGAVRGINIAHGDALANGVGEYRMDTNNHKVYFYWNTTNGWMKEK